MNPQLLIQVNDPELGLLGYVAIDSFIDNKAYGGIRVKISDDPHDEAHPTEAAHLARAMSLKFGFHEISQGGAKSVIVLPPNLGREQRDNYFKAFGKQLSPLLRRNLLQAGLDMGMNGRDLHVFGQGAGLIASHYPPPSGLEKSDSGRFTAIGLIETFNALRDFYSLTDRPLTCALEGFGSVGSHLAQYLSQLNVKLIAISTLTGGLYRPEGLDVRELITLQEEYGDDLVNHYHTAQKIRKEDLYSRKVDVLFPCGGLFSIHPRNVKHLQCKFVISGANCAVDIQCIETLQQLGIGYIPGFVANAGSVLRSYLAKKEKITQMDTLEQRIRQLFDERVKNLLTTSSASGLSLYERSVHIARENITELKRQHELSRPTFVQKVLSLLRKQ